MATRSLGVGQGYVGALPTQDEFARDLNPEIRGWTRRDDQLEHVVHHSIGDAARLPS